MKSLIAAIALSTLSMTATAANYDQGVQSNEYGNVYTSIVQYNDGLLKPIVVVITDSCDVQRGEETTVFFNGGEYHGTMYCDVYSDGKVGNVWLPVINEINQVADIFKQSKEAVTVEFESLTVSFDANGFTNGWDKKLAQRSTELVSTMRSEVYRHCRDISNARYNNKANSFRMRADSYVNELYNIERQLHQSGLSSQSIKNHSTYAKIERLAIDADNNYGEVLAQRGEFNAECKEALSQ